MSVADEIDIRSRSFKANAYQHYVRMREEVPVYGLDLPTRERAFLVFRYNDVSSLLRDKRFSKDTRSVPGGARQRMRRFVPKVILPLMENMLSLDDPAHARLKGLVQSVFSPARVEMLIQSTTETSNRLIAEMKKKRQFDLMADYALPLPVTVISELLGVPPVDRARFARWSKILIDNMTSPLRLLLIYPSMRNFMHYLRALVESKRARPGNDLLSALAAENNREKLSDDEFVAMAAILLIAGHETTTNLIGNGTLALLRNRDAREQIKSDPALFPSAIEEFLRFMSPLEMSTERFATEDTEIAGTMIPRGSMVFGVIASANHDERQFENPGRLDLARKPNRHLTFGEGGHYCVGAALARMEGQVAFRGLLEAFPDMTLAVEPDQLEWRGAVILRGLKKLPVRVG